LEKATLSELLVLEQQVANAIAAKRERERDVLKEKMRKLARDSGFEISELFGRGTRVAPKHGKQVRGKKWSGRGRKVAPRVAANRRVSGNYIDK